MVMVKRNYFKNDQFLKSFLVMTKKPFVVERSGI